MKLVTLLLFLFVSITPIISAQNYIGSWESTNVNVPKFTLTFDSNQNKLESYDHQTQIKTLGFFMEVSPYLMLSYNINGVYQASNWTWYMSDLNSLTLTSFDRLYVYNFKRIIEEVDQSLVEASIPDWVQQKIEASIDHLSTILGETFPENQHEKWIKICIQTYKENQQASIQVFNYLENYALAVSTGKTPSVKNSQVQPNSNYSQNESQEPATNQNYYLDYNYPVSCDKKYSLEWNIKQCEAYGFYTTEYFNCQSQLTCEYHNLKTQEEYNNWLEKENERIKASTQEAKSRNDRLDTYNSLLKMNRTYGDNLNKILYNGMNTGWEYEW